VAPKRETLIFRGVGWLVQFNSLVRLSREGVDVDGGALNGLLGSRGLFSATEVLDGAAEVVAIGFKALFREVVIKDLRPDLSSVCL